MENHKKQIQCKIVMLLALLCFVFIGKTLFSQTPVTIGSGTNVGIKIPVSTYYNYSYSQQIILQSEIATSGTISKIRFFMVGGKNLDNSNNWTIYFGHTTKSSFSSNSNWESVSNLTQVFSGTISSNPSAGWYEIELSSPFDYNNTNNLLVAVDENGAGYNGGSSDNYVRIWTTPTSNRGIYCESDSNNPDPASPPTGTRTSYINQMQ